MASTIKLKNSATAGNTPSSLETGEVAINVTDGNLFYGSASAVLQNFVINELEVKGNLTAQQYTISSSVTNVTFQQQSGSTIFGDTLDDTHLFTGSISVTGSVVSNGVTLTGDQDLSSLATIIQLNASSSTLQTNIDAKASLAQLNASSSALQTNIDTKVDTSGTPADNQISIFTDADTIEGQSRLTFDTNVLKIHRNDTAQGIALFGGQSGVAGAYLSPMGSLTTINFGSSQTGWVFNMQNNKLAFDGDSTNSYIQADTDNPENIEIHADGNIELRADDNLEIHSPISTAITASSNISSSGTIVASNFSGTTSGTNTGDQDLSGFLSSSDQIASGISGSFNNTSASLASRIATNAGNIGTTTNALTVDNATLQLNTGTTFNGSAARTISIKDGGVDSDALAADISVTSLTTTHITASGNISSSSTLTANNIVSTTDIDITTNNEFLRGKTTGGAIRSLIGISSDNIVEVGNTTVDGLELIANPAITASCDVISGSAIVQLKPRLVLPLTSNTDADYYGTVVYFGSNTSGMTAGTIVYYRSTGAWNNAQADSTSTSLGLLGVALGSAASDGVLIQGTVTLNHDPGALGDTLYLSDTNAGRATSTVPSSTNDVVRIIGYCLDASNGQIYFNPSSDHIVHA